MLKIFRKKEGQKGFTLIELMIVIAVIGILASIAITQFMQYRKRGYATTLISDAKNAQTAASSFCSQASLSTAITADDVVAQGFIASKDTQAMVVGGAATCKAYTLTITGAAAWGLTGNTCVINQDGVITTRPSF